MSSHFYIIIVVITFILSFFLSWFVKIIAERLKIFDYPESDALRKIHKGPIPLLGGMAIYFSFVIIALAVAFFITAIIKEKGIEFSGKFPFKHLIGIIIGGGILMIGGFFDDRYRLSPKKQLIAPFLAILTIIVSGIGVHQINNPFSGSIGGSSIFPLDVIKLKIISVGGIPYFFSPFADVLTLAWLFALMYTTKLLDGLDGLTAGLGTIGAIIIFLFSTVSRFAQPDVAFLSSIMVGAFAGFLVWNWHPARLFLGEGGSLFVGFMLGVLAIVSGAKIATTLFIVALPLIDLVWTIVRRARAGK
ncbi:MAG: undecaprenyl/decaprenyl-phosphate alpha-N-acetylglucosaminyl 1-phosphate transferase, partial [Parcubacteria group bacterium]|nr:undecaprenyl/decaprenyl-phosphate alpha-N-acetylglucosaminyl 1-phosphate transferase [Parcubacteria group bacterium]